MATTAFQQRRRSGIGGSDAPAVLGVSPWKSRIGLWEEKIGIRPEDPPSERMVWGTRLEKAIADGWSEDAGIPVRSPGFRRHPTHSFVIGHPDREWGGGRHGLEIKNVERLGAAWIDPDDGETLQAPMAYWVQIQHYALLRGWESARLVLLLRGNSLREIEVPPDPDFQGNLLEAEGDFWEMVRLGIPPEPDGSDDAAQVLRRLYPRGDGESIVATPEIGIAMGELIRVKGEISILEKTEGELKNRILAYMGARSRLLGVGVEAVLTDRGGSVSWKTVAECYREWIQQSAAQLLQRGEVVTISGIGVESEAQIGEILSTVEGLYRGQGVRALSVRIQKEARDGAAVE